MAGPPPAGRAEYVYNADTAQAEKALSLSKPNAMNFEE